MESRPLLKKTSLALAGVFTAVLFGWLLKNFFSFPGLGNLTYAAVGAAIFLAIFLLQALLISDIWINSAAILLEVSSISLFLVGHSMLVLFAGAVVCLVLLITAATNARTVAKDSMEIRFWQISRAGIGLATTALALFSSMAYITRFDLENPVESKKTLEVIIKPMEPFVSSYLPGFSANNSLKQIAANLLPAELKLAPEATTSQLINETAARLAQTFEGFVGIAVRPADSFIDITYKATIGRLLKQSATVQNIILIIAGFLLFLFLKFTLFAVDWVATAIGYGLYRILLELKFFKIDVQNVPKQVIVLT